MRKVIGCVVVILICWLLLNVNIYEKKTVRSIFSWSKEEVRDYQTQFLNDLLEFEFDRVFQSFSSELTEEEIKSFVVALTNENIDLYGLAGAPEWALDATGERMISRLDSIIKINHQLPVKNRMKGLAVNVEPYTLDEFDWQDEEIQKSYLSGMTKLYEAATKEGLELIIVLPYFYDTKGYRDILTVFIERTSSEVAVMNYYRDREIDHLAFEAKIAKQANKPLTTIYEFKAPGSHGLTDKNTYYDEGLMAALKNAEELVAHYNDQTIHIAFHDYHAFRKVIKKE